MRRNARQRAAACLLAVLAQAGFIAFLLQSRAPQTEVEDDSRRLLFIQPLELQQLPPPTPARKPARSIPALIAAAQRAESTQSIEPSPSAPAPPAAPGIDWYGELERSAQIAAEAAEEREQRGSPLDSKPHVLVIPERPHRAGDEERYPDGAVVTWLSERCYVMLDPVSLGPRPMKVCKEATLAERRAEARRKELEKAMKPGYLSRPLPKPRPPDP